MSGGYVSVDFFVNNEVIQDTGVSYNIPGSFQYAKNIYSLNKPIFGCVAKNSLMFNSEYWSATYTGTIGVNEHEAVIILTFVDENNAIKRPVYVITPDDKVMLSI